MRSLRSNRRTELTFRDPVIGSTLPLIHEGQSGEDLNDMEKGSVCQKTLAHSLDRFDYRLSWTRRSRWDRALPGSEDLQAVRIWAAGRFQ